MIPSLFEVPWGNGRNLRQLQPSFLINGTPTKFSLLSWAFNPAGYAYLHIHHVFPVIISPGIEYICMEINQMSLLYYSDSNGIELQRSFANSEL